MLTVKLRALLEIQNKTIKMRGSAALIMLFSDKKGEFTKCMQVLYKTDFISDFT